MRQKFSTPKRVALAAVAAWILGASAPQAAELEVKNPVPTTYTVVKGDTLWGIASRFLKDPWRWPDIWRMNRDAIRNPHRIYPGDVIALDRDASGQWQLSVRSSTVRLSPTVRIEALDTEAIPSIPPGDIEPYLSRPLITGPAGLADAPEIVAGRDDRVVRGGSDVVYVLGLDPKKGDRWHIYRPGRTLVSLDTGEVLGYEQRHVGSGKVERFADVSTLRITASSQEILIGDKLVPVPPEQIINFAPHSPAQPVDGRIIANGRDSVESAPAGSSPSGAPGQHRRRHRARDLSRRSRHPRPAAEHTPRDRVPRVRCASCDPTPTLREGAGRALGPAVRVQGVIRVSYALVVSATDPIHVGDYVRKPATPSAAAGHRRRVGPAPPAMIVDSRVQAWATLQAVGIAPRALVDPLRSLGGPEAILAASPAPAAANGPGGRRGGAGSRPRTRAPGRIARVAGAAGQRSRRLGRR